MTPVELLARALCREYNRGLEDGANGLGHRGASGPAETVYLDKIVEDEWREWIGKAEQTLRHLKLDHQIEDRRD